jgi:hypothetical protein
VSVLRASLQRLVPCYLLNVSEQNFASPATVNTTAGEGQAGSLAQTRSDCR